MEWERYSWAACFRATYKFIVHNNPARSPTNWNATDSDGQTINNDATQLSWHYRRIDLSAFAGKTISQIYLVQEISTTANPWSIYFTDISIVSLDGSVRPLYNRETSISLTHSGTSTGTATINHASNEVLSPDTTTTFYHGDHLGSSRIMSSVNGYPVWQATYLPFGYEYNPQITVNHFKFTGKERDSESGLDNFGARYNASTMGRFMTPDPLLNSGRPWNPQTWNRYAYARNNPLSIVDPTGLYDLNNTCAGDDKKCNKQFQQHANDLKKGLENLQKKVDKMKDGTEKTRLGGSLKALGTEGDHNGVNVGFGATKDGSAATTDPIFDQGSGKYSGFNVTIDPSKENNGANGYAIDAAHEGTHVSDYENYELNPATSMQPFQIEYRGYQTSAWAAQALGFDNISYRGIQIWNSSWGAVDRQTLQDRGITNVVADPSHPEVQPHNPFPNN